MAKRTERPATPGRPARAGKRARHERMSPVDTAWLRMDTPGHPMTIVAMLITATPVVANELRETLRRRLLRFRRFRQRPVEDALGACWQDDPDFDLDAHFVVARLPAPAGQTQLEQLAASLATSSFDPQRPRWQLHLVERYGPGSACILQLHHCYADGVALMQVLMSLTRQDAAAPRATKPRPRDGRADPGFAWRAGAMAAEMALLLTLPDDPATPLRAKAIGRKRLAWCDPLDLAELRVVGQALGCTVNDVLMSTVAGAIGGYLREVLGPDTQGLALRASVPANLRATGEAVTLGNRFGLLFVDLPVGMRDPVQRVLAMHETMRALKCSLQPAATLAVLGLLGLVPGALQAPAVELLSRKGSLVASNVPGPQSPLYLCGQRIEELYFWVPQSGSMGVGISLLSYAGKAFVGIIADAACIDDPQAVVDRIGAEFERLLLAVAVEVLATAGAQRGPAATRPRKRKTRSPVEYT